jgi:hypothetical protein
MANQQHRRQRPFPLAVATHRASSTTRPEDDRMIREQFEMIDGPRQKPSASTSAMGRQLTASTTTALGAGNGTRLRQLGPEVRERRSFKVPLERLAKNPSSTTRTHFIKARGGA